MKKFTTLLLFALFLVSASAMAQQTKLSVSNFNNYALRIIIDRNTYNYDRSRDADFVLSNLTPGNHNIKIYRVPVRRRGEFGSNAITVLYDANIYLRPQYFTDIMINRFGRVFKDEQLIDGNNYPVPTNPTNPNYPTNPNFPNNPNNPYPGYNPAMSDQLFSSLKATIANESFDNSRMNIAKQAVAANYFTSTQAKQIVELFSYDNSRLEIAKALYPRVTDKQGYFIVNDAFSYSSSKDALAEFIRQNP